MNNTILSIILWQYANNRNNNSLTNEKWYQINYVCHKYERIIKKNIKNIKYKLNEQQYTETGHSSSCQAVNIGRPVLCKGLLSLTLETCWDGHQARCIAVNARHPTSWRGSSGTMEIVDLPGSTSDRIVLLRP